MFYILVICKVLKDASVSPFNQKHHKKHRQLNQKCSNFHKVEANETKTWFGA